MEPLITPINPLREHPLRHVLNNEVHARPPVSVAVPEQVSFLALLQRGTSPEQESAHLARLGERLGVALPIKDGAHLVVDFPAFRLKWERHNEFSSYYFFRKPQPDDLPEATALSAVPADWLGGIPGQLLVATHVEYRSVREMAPEAVRARYRQSGPAAVGARVADGGGWVFTDFLIGPDGYSRFVLLDDGMTRRQAGRTIQRLVEIETYRMMALLALPKAKEVGKLISRAEQDLAKLMRQMGENNSPDDEREVLQNLTNLASEVEASLARTSFRFGAGAAYHRLVQQRIADLREERLPHMPPIGEFMERRLSPAMATCAAIARRQEELSARISRSSQLLRTRVDIELERQNQELLGQMNKRAKLQLRLQETVEGLSVVVLTYYGSQLVQYLAKGTKDLHHASPDVITAISIPVIACLVAWGTHRMRKALAAEEGQGH